MKFLIANTFSQSLGKLQAQEQKAAKVTALDLQMDPSLPGLQFHRISNSKDANFWSIRVSRDLRIIVHKTANSFLICYVGHHDDAYAWAERRRVDTHPRTGAAQIVEVRERVEEIPVYVEVAAEAPPEPKIFASLAEDELLGVGVPEEWLTDVQNATENSFFDLHDHLPGEASEALLNFATGGKLSMGALLATDATPFEHPDAMRRFRSFDSVDELKTALDLPWEQWIVFLHPSQRAVVERDFNGPARVTGSAGTGKTIVALHRAARHLREDVNARVLLTSFSSPLANSIKGKLALLLSEEQHLLDRATVLSFKGIAKELFMLINGHEPRIANEKLVSDAISAAKSKLDYQDNNLNFLLSEWRNVVDAWQITDIESYSSVQRIGRRNRLGNQQRARLWPVFEQTKRSIKSMGRTTWDEVFQSVADYYVSKPEKPFSHVIVDESQDLSVTQLRMLSAISADSSNCLFFAGDIGQRIFQEPFSWKSLGIDIRGRSSTLKVNYRTSHQIRLVIDKLLPETLRDADGNEDSRQGVVSVINGTKPNLRDFSDQQSENTAVSVWIGKQISQGIEPHEIGIFTRETDQLIRARRAVQQADQSVCELSERQERAEAAVRIGTMHLAKGLEFRSVCVMACDDGILPLENRLDISGDEDELELHFETERHLFYVACTRARDDLLVTSVRPRSEFIDDLEQSLVTE